MYGANPMAGMDAMMPAFDGKWTNKLTGKTIMIRDNYIEDDKMMLSTNTGEIISMDEFSRNYFQVDDNISENAPTQQPININNIDEISSVTADNGDWLNSPIESNIQDVPKTIIESPKQTKEKEASVLDKLFEKSKSLPKVKASLSWNNFPSAKINMLKELFDITNEDISDYIYKHYCDELEIKKAISESLENIFKKDAKTS